MKPLALDLCCGKGGWTKGLMAAGWKVHGVDIEEWPDYPGVFFKRDVRELNFAPGVYKLVVASPPCQEFSRLHLPFFKKEKELMLKEGRRPDESIWRACERISKNLKAPLVLENVVGAQHWMGKAKWRYGPYYLWGDVPTAKAWEAPRGKVEVKNVVDDRYLGGMRRFQKLKLPSKGMDFGYDEKGKRVLKGGRQFSSHSKQRKEYSANAAKIPYELSLWIGKCFYPKEV